MSSSSRHGPSSSLTTPSDVRYKKVTPQQPILRNAFTTPPFKTPSKARVRFSSIPDRGRKKPSVRERIPMDWQGEEAEWTDSIGAESGSDTEVSSDDDVDTLFPLVFGRNGSESSRTPIDPNYRKDCKKVISNLERGPLTTSPRIDLEAFTELFFLAKHQSDQILDFMGRGCSDALRHESMPVTLEPLRSTADSAPPAMRPLIESYESEARHTDLCLMEATERLVGSEARMRSEKLEFLVQKLALVASQVNANQRSIARDLARIHSTVNSKLSVLRGQWESAESQYGIAFDRASKLSRPPKKLNDQGRSQSRTSTQSTEARSERRRTSTIESRATTEGIVDG